MARNSYFSMGTQNEQLLIEDIIIESLKIYGQDIFYIPRKLVSKDDILGEDRLSEFKTAYPVEMYFENVDSFDGQGAFIQKFGLMMEQSATLVVARRRWNQLIGRHGQTIIPSRPSEGDLIYFPLTKGLFEIRFVQHQDPFYQLGKLYVYKLQVELFQYASERIDTGIPDIDVFESLKTFNVDPAISMHGGVDTITITNSGSNYTAANITFVPAAGDRGTGALGTATITNGAISAVKITNPGSGYKIAPSVVITGDGIDATASSTISTIIDNVESYGDNNTFIQQAEDIVFNSNNPFGD